MARTLNKGENNMSHFYGYLQGNRGVTTRGGSRKSGISAHLRSWNHDCYAWLYDDNGEDTFKITCPTDNDITLIVNSRKYIVKNGIFVPEEEDQ